EAVQLLQSSFGCDPRRQVGVDVFREERRRILLTLPYLERAPAVATADRAAAVSDESFRLPNQWADHRQNLVVLFLSLTRNVRHHKHWHLPPPGVVEVGRIPRPNIFLSA